MTPALLPVPLPSGRGIIEPDESTESGDVRRNQPVGDTPFGPCGFEIAALAAGGVMAGRLRSAYALVRPHGLGFCVFNVDWDVHHGNGAERVTYQVAPAIEQGRRFGPRSFFDPCIIANVPRSADVAIDDEIFGPVLTCIPFDTEEEAVLIANQSSFGLSGGVFSRDRSRALQISDRLACGGVVVSNA